MSYVEAPEKTVLRFSRSWNEQVISNRLVSNLISLNRETNREPDIYDFWVENGILVDPDSGKPVLDFVLPGVERKVAEELQAWAGNHEEGIAFWISPSLEGVYPCSKVILHRISYFFNGKKVIQNAAILFDADFENPETLRQTLFTLADTEENISRILQWVAEKSGHYTISSSDKVKLRKQAVYYAEMFKRGISREYIIEEMRKTGFLGQYPISCPREGRSFSELIISRSSISLFSESKGWHNGECRVCKTYTWIGPCNICKNCESKF